MQQLLMQCSSYIYKKAIPETFGALSSYLLNRACAEKGNELHMVFDKLQSPSIKDCER